MIYWFVCLDDTEEDGGLNDSVDQLETEKQALILLKKLQDLKVTGRK